MAEFIVSRHALKRAIDMCVEGDQIRDAVLNPRWVNHPPGKNVTYRTRGHITCVVSEDAPPTVITILWASMSDWERDHASVRSRTSDADDYREAAAAQRRLIKGRKKHGRNWS